MEVGASGNAPSMTATALSAASPADRPRGRRGWRGWLAAALAAGAPVIILAARVEGGSTGGGDGELGVGGAVYHYELGGPPGIELKGALAALVLVAAAVLVWTARNARTLLAAAVLTAAAVGSTVLVASRFDGDEITRAELRALEPGLSRSEVEDRLGAPSGTGSYDSDARGSLDCVLWTLAKTSVQGGHALVCFDGDRFRFARIV